MKKFKKESLKEFDLDSFPPEFLEWLEWKIENLTVQEDEKYYDDGSRLCELAEERG